MKISLIFFIYELISVVLTKNTLKIYLNPEVTCDADSSKSKIVIIFLSNNPLSYAEFSLKLKDKFNTGYIVSCYINKIRYFFSKIVESYCLFSPPYTTTSLHYENNSIQYKNNYDFNFQFNTNIEINTKKCISLLEAKELINTKLSFDHIDDFKIINNIATFTFYGLSKYTYKNYGINIDIYLYTEDGKREMETAECRDNFREIINDNSLKRIKFTCSVKISNKNYIKLEYYNSKSISGVPYNSYHLLFLLIDQPITNKNTNENIVDLTIKSIDFSKAESDGIFYINLKQGYTTNAYFTIPLTYPCGLEAICKMIEMDVKSNLGQSKKKYAIECRLDGEVNNLPMIFEQRTIEVTSNLKFLIFYYDSIININCINGVAKEQNKENQLETSLFLLQMNNYQSEFGNDNSFNLYALSTKQMAYNDFIILNMRITKIDSNGYESYYTSNITCLYDQIVQIVSSIYSKISFNCLHETQGVVRDLILISSPNFTSLPESSSLKSPIATDEQIKDNLIISAESKNYNIPILFNPTQLKMKSCDNTGKFLIKGIISSSIFYEGGFYLKIRLPKQDKLKCFFNNYNNNLNQFGIICEYPLAFIGKRIKIEIQNVKYGNNENFIFWNFYSSENLFCNFDENEETNTPIINITEISDIYTSINSEKDNASISENPLFETNTTVLKIDTSGEIIEPSIISDSNQTGQDLNNITDEIEIYDNLAQDTKESDFFHDDSGQINDNKSELIVPSNSYDILDNITNGIEISIDTYTDIISQSNDTINSTNNENQTNINIIETDKNISFTETESEIEFSNTNSIESETVINSTENETFKTDNITKYENNSINESDFSNNTNKVITETIIEIQSSNSENEKSDFNSETTGISESSIDISNYIDYITNSTEIYEEEPSTTINPETENITEYHEDITNESNYSLNDTIISNNSNERVDEISEASNQIINTDENITYDNDTIDESTYQNNISYISENDTNTIEIEIEPSIIIPITYIKEPTNEIDYIEITEQLNETDETEYTKNSVNISKESENINNESLNSASDSFIQNIDTITDININITKNNISEIDISTYSNFPEYLNYTNYTDYINNETINYQDNTSIPIFIDDTININKTELIINKTDFDINENNETSDIINQTDYGYDKDNKSDTIINTEKAEQSDTINESDSFYGNATSITNRTSEIYMSSDIIYDSINYTEKTDNITYERTEINSINVTYNIDNMNDSHNINNSNFIENTTGIEMPESYIINITEYNIDHLTENISDKIISDNSINESNITDIITNNISDSQQIINDSTDIIKINETNILTNNEYNSSISDTIKETNILNETNEAQFTTITSHIKSPDTKKNYFINNSIDIIKNNKTNILTTDELNSSISDIIIESENPNETNETQFTTTTSNIGSQYNNNSYDTTIIESDKSKTDINSISDISESNINEINNTSNNIYYPDATENNYSNISESSNISYYNIIDQTEYETNNNYDSSMIENITSNHINESDEINSGNIINITTNKESIIEATDSYIQNMDTNTDISININNTKNISENISETDISKYSIFPDYLNNTDNINTETVNDQDNTSIPIFINDTGHINKTEVIINKTDINENNETSDIISQTDSFNDKDNKSDEIIITEKTELSDTINESDSFYGNDSITNRTSEIYISSDITYDGINYTEKTDNITYERTEINSINVTYNIDNMNGSQNINNTSFIENTNTIKIESETINITEYNTDYLTENITDNIISDRNNSINESNITDIITNNISDDTININGTITLTNNEYNIIVNSTIIETNISNEAYGTEFTTITSNIKSQDINNSDFINNSAYTIKENETTTLTTQEYNSSISDTIKESDISNKTNETTNITSNIESQYINNSYNTTIIESDKSRTDINNISDIPQSNINELNNTSDKINYSDTSEYNSDNISEPSDFSINSNTIQTDYETNINYDSSMIAIITTNDMHESEDVQNNSDNITNYTVTIDSQHIIMETTNYITNNTTINDEAVTTDSLTQKIEPNTDININNTTNLSEIISETDKNSFMSEYSTYAGYTENETSNYQDNTWILFSNNIDTTSTEFISNGTSDEVSQSDSHYDNGSITDNIPEINLTSDITNDKINDTNNISYASTEINSIIEAYNTDNINGSQNINHSNFIENTTTIEIQESNITNNTECNTNYLTEKITDDIDVTNNISSSQQSDINDSSNIAEGTNTQTTEEYINSTIKNTIIGSEFSIETYETQFIINTSTIDSQYINNSDIVNDSNSIAEGTNTLTTEEYTNSTINSAESENSNEIYETQFIINTSSIESQNIKNSSNTIIIENDTSRIDTYNVTDISQSDFNINNTHDAHNETYYSDTTEYTNENISESSNIYNFSDQTSYETNDTIININTNTNDINESVTTISDMLINNNSEIDTEQASIINKTSSPVNNSSDISTISTQNFSYITDTENISTNMAGNNTIEPTMEHKKSGNESDYINQYSENTVNVENLETNSVYASTISENIISDNAPTTILDDKEASDIEMSSSTLSNFSSDVYSDTSLINNTTSSSSIIIGSTNANSENVSEPMSSDISESINIDTIEEASSKDINTTSYTENINASETFSDIYTNLNDSTEDSFSSEKINSSITVDSITPTEAMSDNINSSENLTNKEEFNTDSQSYSETDTINATKTDNSSTIEDESSQEIIINTSNLEPTEDLSGTNYSDLSTKDELKYTSDIQSEIQFSTYDILNESSSIYSENTIEKYNHSSEIIATSSNEEQNGTITDSQKESTSSYYSEVDSSENNTESIPYKTEYSEVDSSENNTESIPNKTEYSEVDSSEDNNNSTESNSDNTEYQTTFSSIISNGYSDSINIEPTIDSATDISSITTDENSYTSSDIYNNDSEYLVEITDVKILDKTDNEHITDGFTKPTESIYSNESLEIKTNEFHVENITNDIINYEDESLQNAKYKANITLSFRQINKFKTEENSIGFYLYCITTKDLHFDAPINISVNLIKKSGEKEESSRIAKCILIKSVFISEAYSAPAEFKCEISYIPGNEYYSLRYNNSEYISGIPNDEYALNPKLTEEKINKGEFIDYSLENNSMIIAPVFSYDIISMPPTKDDYIFSFNGTLSGALPQEINTNFIMPLSYPIGVTFFCWFDKTDIGFNNATISCISDRNLKNVSVIIEQNVIRKNGKDYFSLKSINEHFDECTSGKLVQAVERLNISHAFKEVSDYKFSKISYSLTFKLYTISSQMADKNYSLNINMTITFKNESFFDKKANCSLIDYINKTNDFLFYENEYRCFLFLGELSNSEEIDFNKPKTVVVSLENNEISGINHLELTQRSPLGRDKKTNKIKGFSVPTKENDSNDTDLIQLNLSLYNYNNLGKEINQGKIKLLGSFSQDISGEINFDLPLDFPAINLKCRLLNPKKYIKTDIICKNQKELHLIEDFVIEKKFIMKDNEILFFVNSTKIKFDETQHWNDYNKYRYEKAKKRLNSNYYFVDLINEPSNNNNEFSMLLGLKNTNNNMAPIPMKLNLIKNNNKFRNLDIDLQMKELTAQCEPDIKKGDFAKFICSIPDNMYNGEIKIEDYELNADETEISGILGRNDINKSNIFENYNKDELSIFDDAINSINDTPIIEIDYINGDLCEEKGSYSIMGHITKSQKKTFSYSDISIYLSSPDSIGTCDITTIKDNNTNSNIALNCLNQEKFSLSQILLETTVIKDSNGSNIFRLNSFSSANHFSCSVGKKAEKNTPSIFDPKYMVPTILIVMSILSGVAVVIINYWNYWKEKFYCCCCCEPNKNGKRFEEDIMKEINHNTTNIEKLKIYNN